MYQRTPHWGHNIIMPGLGQDDDTGITDVPVTTVDTGISDIFNTSSSGTSLSTDGTVTASGLTDDQILAAMSASNTISAGDTANSTAYLQPTYTTASGAVASTPSGALQAPAANNNSAWAAFAAQLAKSGATLATISAIKPGEVVLPNGTVIGSATSAQTSSLLGGGSISSTTWMIGGAALAAVLLLLFLEKR